MRRIAGGALIALLIAQAGVAGVLTATLEDGTEIARFEIPEGSGWCVLWRHSVKGFEVADCYENRGGRMVLVRSHLPDFAAGLDHIPGRGRQVSDGGGGYWIEDLDEPVPGDAYVLRLGRGNVDHRLRVGDDIQSLSERAPRARVRIALTGDRD
ncbi:hypothetical protein DEA8626_02809 [Defluviimonas aquaemixtae]|uniref:DUF1850 domain-containing protein n=1 Tax=Albidovulum aquaemixtae TaxID=1542388 RepID=A0A2R8BKB7_9RHOB|nr:DUF1850 domain-containing protein [Defluviimonas aquaemixtae]SPH23740.1 hypothetical protein DEA8626_02809 [Defluviimonas aquaemixtae]